MTRVHEAEQDAAMRVVRGRDATAVMASADFAVVPYGARYGVLADRLKLSFDGIRFAFAHIPLSLDGPDHAAQRADVGRLIADRKAAVAAALPGIVAGSFAALSVPGPVDVLRSVVVPCVDAVMAEMVGIPVDAPDQALISRIFSQSMGVARRKRLEAEVSGLIARLAEAFPGDTPLRRGSRLTLVILGRDSLIGTLARSLHALFAQAAGRPLSEVALPRVPSHTGVPFIDRQARCPVTVPGMMAAQGEVLRCLLQSLEAAPDDDRLRFFGAGAHLCLGRAVTLDLFARISDHLAAVTTRIDLTGYALREDDVFACPDVFLAQVRR